MSADRREPAVPALPFLAAKVALEAIEEAVHIAQRGRPGRPAGPEATSEQALATLLLLREMRDQLAGWETGLVEVAREAGASWADLAHPLGVASRQAAERRYLRLRPGAPGTTGEERIQATRERRAADRTVSVWARDNAADLRRLAAETAALTGLPAEARRPLVQALGSNDVAALVEPLTSARDHLPAGHRDVAARIDTVARRTGRLRQDSSATTAPPEEPAG